MAFLGLFGKKKTYNTLENVSRNEISVNPDIDVDVDFDPDFAIQNHINIEPLGKAIVDITRLQNENAKLIVDDLAKTVGESVKTGAKISAFLGGAAFLAFLVAR